MKRIILAGTLLLMTVASCSKDDEYDDPISSLNLVSPELTAYVNNTDQSTSPLTGFLDIYPCTKGTSVYFGNYIDEKLTVFNAFYPIENGEIYSGYYRKLLLPEDTYNLVYWGTPVSNDDTYDSPSIKNPEITLGADLSTLYLELRKNQKDDTYNPTFDLIYAVKEKNLASDDLSTSLDRAVAGLKVIVKTADDSQLSSNISTMEVHINNIAEKLNFYTAQPENKTKTVKFALNKSADGKQMTNGTVMLFPSDENPLLELNITLSDGSVHSVSKKLNTTLTANNRLTLTIIIGDTVGEDRSEKGYFTVRNWIENSETIEFPTIP